MLPLVTRVLASVFCLSVVVPAEATLMGRLPGTPGGTDYQAAYDDALEITWLTDADLSGAGTWQDQLDWVSSLNSANHLGFNDWRLASMSVAAGLPTGTTNSVVDCSSVSETACRDNELGYMYYHNLSGNFGDDLRGDQTVGDVTLTDIQPLYWSGTEFGSFAWLFFFDFGLQGGISKDNVDLYGWAVRSGDVAAVPEPGTVVLMGAGLAGLLGFGRHKRRR